MIAKRILPKKEKSTRPHYDFKELAEYVRAAGHEGEKCQFAWHGGCHSENYDQAMMEIMAVQALNTRTSKDKTYHLVISFRPEDETKLSPEVFQEIEQMFAKALGFDEHQRVCGVHRNTNNMHMHIAYNKIHPEKLTIREPYRDFYKLAEACKAIEEKYGLLVDNKLKKDQQIDQHAASMEAHSGEQSFQSYVLEKKEPLLQSLENATTWREAHVSLARYGLGIKARGNGLVVYNLDGKKNEAMKASALDRCLSKKNLLDRFGEYEEPGDLPESVERYNRSPIQPQSTERDQLYEQYKNLMQKKQDRLDASRKQSAKNMQAVMDWADAERKVLDRRILPRSTKAKLRQLLNVEQRQAIEDVREAGNTSLQAIRKSYPCHNWNGYLKWQAEQGNETALNALRSKKEKDRSLEVDQAKPIDHGEKYTEAHRIKKAFLEKERQIIISSVSGKHRSGLVAITRMQQLAALENLKETGQKNDQELFAGVRHTIDNNGIVIFTLAGGGTIRDTGKKIYFSQDEETKKAAMIYSQARLGKNIQVIENSIERKPYERNNGVGHHKPNPAVIGQINQNRLRGLSELDVVRFGKSPEVLLPGHARGDVER